MGSFAYGNLVRSGHGFPLYRQMHSLSRPRRSPPDFMQRAFPALSCLLAAGVLPSSPCPRPDPKLLFLTFSPDAIKMLGHIVTK